MLLPCRSRPRGWQFCAVASAASLLCALHSTTMYWRRHGRRPRASTNFLAPARERKQAKVSLCSKTGLPLLFPPTSLACGLRCLVEPLVVLACHWPQFLPGTPCNPPRWPFHTRSSFLPFCSLEDLCPLLHDWSLVFITALFPRSKKCFSLPFTLCSAMCQSTAAYCNVPLHTAGTADAGLGGIPLTGLGAVRRRPGPFANSAAATDCNAVGAGGVGLVGIEREEEGERAWGNDRHGKFHGKITSRTYAGRKERGGAGNLPSDDVPTTAKWYLRKSPSFSRFCELFPLPCWLYSYFAVRVCVMAPCV